MKFRSLFLALVLVAGLSLSSSAFAQDDKTKTQIPNSQQQTAAQKTTTADQNQVQPADQKPAATDQNANQPVADQNQPAADQSKDADKKDADKTDKDQAKKDKKELDKEKKEAEKEKKEAKKNKHSGGKDDVDAIGNRKVAGWDWYSIESEIRMGKEYATQIEASLKLVTDPTINEYVNRVGQNLVRNSDAKVPFTIKVVDSDVINAMALPGGFFYVNSGLIPVSYTHLTLPTKA